MLSSLRFISHLSILPKITGQINRTITHFASELNPYSVSHQATNCCFFVHQVLLKPWLRVFLGFRRRIDNWAEGVFFIVTSEIKGKRNIIHPSTSICPDFVLRECSDRCVPPLLWGYWGVLRPDGRYDLSSLSWICRGGLPRLDMIVKKCKTCQLAPLYVEA